MVSNHPDFAELAASYRIPFRHIPVYAADQGGGREPAARGDRRHRRRTSIVLARYMQILSGEVVQARGGPDDQHPPLLPAELQGAKPYQQAHARGVKLFGATAHYVTTDLDEGPIIEQDVTGEPHASPERLAEAARDVEAQVLARAVTWHAEHRVLLNGDRTVVFH